MALRITIYSALEAKLGRTPTDAEIKAEVERKSEEMEILRCCTGGEFGSCRDGRDPELCANCERMAASEALIESRSGTKR